MPKMELHEFELLVIRALRKFEGKRFLIGELAKEADISMRGKTGEAIKDTLKKLNYTTVNSYGKFYYELSNNESKIKPGIIPDPEGAQKRLKLKKVELDEIINTEKTEKEDLFNNESKEESPSKDIKPYFLQQREKETKSSKDDDSKSLHLHEQSKKDEKTLSLKQHARIIRDFKYFRSDMERMAYEFNQEKKKLQERKSSLPANQQLNLINKMRPILEENVYKTLSVKDVKESVPINGKQEEDFVEIVLSNIGSKCMLKTGIEYIIHPDISNPNMPIILDLTDKKHRRIRLLRDGWNPRNSLESYQSEWLEGETD